jgi:hypothetical protein
MSKEERNPCTTEATRTTSTLRSAKVSALRFGAESKRRLTVEQSYWLEHFPVAPTKDGLVRHVERFSSECVEEIADAYESS